MNRLLKNPPKGPHMQIKISTWVKDSHGLYDYQGSQDSFTCQTYYVKNSSKLFREVNKGETMLDNGNKLNRPPFAFIAGLQIDKSKAVPQFKVKPRLSQNQVLFHKATYLSVRDFHTNDNIGFPLKPGNLIKLGRIQFMLVQQKNQVETHTIKGQNYFQEVNGVYQINKNQLIHHKDFLAGESYCRICLSTQYTKDDPLISPCLCKGTCSFVHVSCLKLWINSKVKKQIKGIVASYNFTKFQCQICKFPFPQIIRFEDKDVQMITIARPNKPYIILESLQNKESKQGKCLHLISTEQNAPVKIGRSHDCQIKLNDVSVSRNHAEIVFKKGSFYIIDTKAKFGTLIKFEEEQILTPNKSVRIQCGRSVYEFKAKQDALQDIDTQ